MGTIMVAGHQIAQNYGSLVFMIPPGHRYDGGNHSRRLLLRSEKTGPGKNFGNDGPVAECGFALLICLLSIVFRHGIAAIYNNDPGRSLICSCVLMFYVGAYQLVDGLQMTGIGVLRGYNDTVSYHLSSVSLLIG